jgi:hypothetical protein
MEHEPIKALLEKYWLAETTVEEEKTIADYFRGGDIDPVLEPYRPFFDYIEEESQVSPSPDLETRILAAVQPVRSLWGLKTGYAAAAAVILCVSSLFLALQLSRDPETPGTPQVAQTPATTAPTQIAQTTIKDTYDDPEKALAAVRRALLVASTAMNEGKGITEKNMHRLNTSWQAASFK